MVIKKILNNGAVLTTNQDGEEIVALGKGIAFNKKAGDSIDKQRSIKFLLLLMKGRDPFY